MRRFIFVSPAVDFLSSRMRFWLEEAAAGAAGSIAIKLFGLQAAWKILYETLVVASANLDRVVVFFYGHGSRQSLLTAQQLGKSSVGRGFGVLCDETDIPRGSSVSVVSYSCNAAKELGIAVRNVYEGNAFLGFTDEICFTLRNEVEEGAFKRPMNRLVELILSGKDVDQSARTSLVNEYQEVYNEWDFDQRSQEDGQLLVLMCLETHWRSLDREV